MRKLAAMEAAKKTEVEVKVAPKEEAIVEPMVEVAPDPEPVAVEEPVVEKKPKRVRRVWSRKATTEE